VSQAAELQRPLVPHAVRRPAVGVAALAAVVTVLLGIRYHDATRPGWVDSWVFGELPTTVRRHRRGLVALANLVDTVPVVLVATVLAVLFLASRRWGLAVVALAGPGATGLVVELAKHLVDRTLDGKPSLPSGHTAGVTSLLLVVALAILGRVRGHVVPKAAFAMLLVTAGAAGVGLTMVLLRWHYATDTVAGFGTAIAVTIGLALLIDVVRARRRR
jgi:undecaprenyl-diphosphatase